MKSLGGFLPRHGHQTINLSKIETDPTKLYLGTRTPSPARATMTHGSHTLDLNLTRDRYNTGNQGFIRPLFEFRHFGETGEEWVSRRIKLFPPSADNKAPQIPCPFQPSIHLCPGLDRQNSRKHQLSWEPDPGRPLSEVAKTIYR